MTHLVNVISSILLLNHFGSALNTTVQNSTQKSRSVPYKQNILKKIIGGKPVQNETLYPFMASLHAYNQIGKPFCGGSIIKPNWILTAAHCIVYSETGLKTNEIVVAVGIIDLIQLKQKYVKLVEKLFPHKFYRIWSNDNDIGLVLLKHELKLDKNINLIKMPQNLFRSDMEPIGLFNNCETMGWGSLNEYIPTYPSKMMLVELPLINRSECQNYYSKSTVSSNNVCTLYKPGNKDACYGDSGGPLVCNQTLIGIVSWGKGCGEWDKPGVFIRVDRYLKWIESVTSMRDYADTFKKKRFLIFLIVIHHRM